MNTNIIRLPQRYICTLYIIYMYIHDNEMYSLLNAWKKKVCINEKEGREYFLHHTQFGCFNLWGVGMFRHFSLGGCRIHILYIGKLGFGIVSQDVRILNHNFQEMGISDCYSLFSNSTACNILPGLPRGNNKCSLCMLYMYSIIQLVECLEHECEYQIAILLMTSSQSTAYLHE